MKLMIVGDHWSEKDEEAGRPYQGAGGWIFKQCLAQIGMTEKDFTSATVFELAPPRGSVYSLCGTKAEATKLLPEIAKGKYLRASFDHHLLSLYEKVKETKPNLILTTGAIATWAFLETSKIKAVRGAVALSQIPHIPPTKCLPTYAPSTLNRDMSLRPVFLSDLDKARKGAATPEYSRPEREIWTRPTLEDLEEFEEIHLKGSTLVAADIETRSEQITCFGFSPNPSISIVIPFYLEDGSSYWTLEEELIAWSYVRKWLASYPTVFQNGMYDMHFSWRKYGLPTPKASEDTMLLHHAWQIEMEKGLGFLATLYTDEASWKFMRKGTRHD